MSTVADICRVLDSAYPPHLAESWDKVGLICGELDAEVTTVAFALDCTAEVVEAGIAAGAQMLVVHHPLLLFGTHTVAAHTPKGRIIHRLIRAGMALFAAHTNADSARPGVNDRLAELIGVTPGRPLEIKDDNPLDKWGVMVPATHAEEVKNAVFSAGAGAIGDYTECAFQWTGKGQFRPGAEANPTLGSIGRVHYEPEVRVEFVGQRGRREAIMQALCAAHPYEEVAFDIIAVEPTTAADTACGLGRIGELEKPMRFTDFVQQVADRLPATTWGVRAAGDPERMVQKIAVSSGAGDSHLGAAQALGADVFLTSDLRHHPVDEALRDPHSPAIIDTAHWASEFPWCQQAAEIVAERAGVDVTVLDIRTDPWTISTHPQESTQP